MRRFVAERAKHLITRTASRYRYISSSQSLFCSSTPPTPSTSAAPMDSSPSGSSHPVTIHTINPKVWFLITFCGSHELIVWLSIWYLLFGPFSLMDSFDFCVSHLGFGSWRDPFTIWMWTFFSLPPAYIRSLACCSMLSLERLLSWFRAAPLFWLRKSTTFIYRFFAFNWWKAKCNWRWKLETFLFWWVSLFCFSKCDFSSLSWVAAPSTLVEVHFSVPLVPLMDLFHSVW